MPISEYIKHLRKHVGSDLLQMPCVAAVVHDRGKVLVTRRADNGLWCLPGGAIDPDEAPAQAIVREVREETGLLVRPSRILGVFGGHRHIYPNGDQTSITSIAFACYVIGGELQCNDGEVSEMVFVAPDAIPKLMFSYPPKIFLDGQAEPHFEWNDAWLT